MAPFLSPNLLSDARRLKQGLMTDSCAIARTGSSLPCRAWLMTKDQRLGGMADIIRIRRWSLEFPDASDVKPGDLGTLTGKAAGLYFLSELISGDTLSTSTDAEAIKIEGTVAASTKRKPATTPALGTSSVMIAQLTGLVAWQLGGSVLHPVSSAFAHDALGADVAQPARAFLSWPAGDVEDLPIQTRDRLVLPSGEYQVAGVLTYPGSYLEVFVDLEEK